MHVDASDMRGDIGDEAPSSLPLSQRLKFVTDPLLLDNLDLSAFADLNPQHW